MTLQGKLVGALVAAGVAAGAVALWMADDEPPSPEAPPTTGEVAGEAEAEVVAEGETAPRVLTCDFAEGDSLAWDVDLVVFSRFRVGSVEIPGLPLQNAGDQRYDLRFGGRMEWRVIGPEGKNGWLVAARMRDTTQVLNDTPSDALGEGYDHPFLLRIDDACTIRGMALHPAADERTRMAHQNLVLLAEFVLPDDRSLNHWTAEQLDDTGIYFADYQVVGMAAKRDRADMPVDAPARMAKVRERYLRARPVGQGLEAEPDVVASKDEFALAPDGRWAERVKVHLELAYESNGRTLVDKQIDLTLAATEPPGDGGWADTLDLDAYRWWEREALTAGGSEPPSIDRRSRSYTDARPIPGLENRSMASVMEEFAALVQAGDGRSLRRAQLLLIQYLRLHPEAANKLLDRLREEGMSEAERAHAFFALEAAGTPEAKGVLVTALNDADMSWADRSRAAVALADVPDLDHEVFDQLQGASRWKPGDERDPSLAAFQNTSLMAMGAMGSNVGEGSSLAQAVRREIEQRLVETREPMRLGAALGAAGNTEDPSLWPVVQEHLSDQNSHVREMSAVAAKSLAGDDLWPTMLDRLRVEEEPDVRARLLDALLSSGEVPPEAMGVLGDALAKEESVAVRLRLVRLLGKVADEQPAAKDLLVALLDTERTPEILIEIGKYVDATEHL